MSASVKRKDTRLFFNTDPFHFALSGFINITFYGPYRKWKRFSIGIPETKCYYCNINGDDNRSQSRWESIAMTLFHFGPSVARKLVVLAGYFYHISSDFPSWKRCVELTHDWPVSLKGFSIRIWVQTFGILAESSERKWGTKSKLKVLIFRVTNFVGSKSSPISFITLYNWK